jgi:hypothetical protein
MIDQPIEPDLSPPAPEALTPGERVLLWVDHMRSCEKLLLAGLRLEIGPDGDLQAAYREWYENRMRQHDAELIHLLQEFNRRMPNG